MEGKIFALDINIARKPTQGNLIAEKNLANHAYDYEGDSANNETFSKGLHN